MQTINVMPAPWLTTKQVVELLGMHERTVQQMAKDGRIATKPAGNPRQPLARLYDAKDIDRIITGKAVKREPKALSNGSMPRDRRTPEEMAALRKPTQPERALDTVSIVGQMLIGQKADRELLIQTFETIVTQGSRNMENVVNLILTAHKAEADANRERLKAEREDMRERWEIERQDRIERQRS